MFYGYPCKNVTKYFCTFFRFRTFCLFSLFQKKTPILVTAKGFSLLSSVYGLVRDLNFFYAFPNTPLNLLKQEKLFVLLQLDYIFSTLWAEIIFCIFFSFQSVKSFYYKRFIQAACLNLPDFFLTFLDHFQLIKNNLKEVSNY